MRRRIRWFHLTMTAPVFRTLVAGIQTEQYSDRRGHGFVVSEVRAKYLEGKHIERRRTTIVSVDPAGEELRQQMTSFAVTSFRISMAGPGLEIHNAPRTGSLFFARLDAHSKHDLTIEPFDVDPLAWASEIESEMPASVTRIDYANIAFNRNAVASMRLKATQGDVRPTADSIVGKRSRLVQRVGLRFLDEEAHGKPVECVMDRAARISVAADATDEAIQIVGRALMRVRAAPPESNPE